MKKELFQPLPIKSASTFTGFCAGHDKSLFAPIDDSPLVPTKEQVLLLGFRSCSRELYAKQGVLSMREGLMQLDAGMSPPDQRRVQRRVSAVMRGHESGLSAIRKVYDSYVGALEAPDDACVEWLLLEFDADVVALCSTQWHAEYDFCGNVLQDLSQLFVSFESISIEFLPSALGRQVVLLSWLGRANAPRRLAQTFLALGESEYSAAAFRLLLVATENCFFKPSWWSALPRDLVVLANEQQIHGNYLSVQDELAFWMNNDVRYANWRVARVETQGDWSQS